MMYEPFDKETASARDRVAWALCQIIDDDAPLRWTRYRFAAACIASNPEVMQDLAQLSKEQTCQTQAQAGTVQLNNKRMEAMTDILKKPMVKRYEVNWHDGEYLPYESDDGRFTLHSDYAALQADYEREACANREWSEKTEWTQGTISRRYLGWHRADGMSEEIRTLTAERDALLSQLGGSVGVHQNYSALPKSPYARPHVSGSATTPTSKVEVTDEMINWKPASEHPDVLNASTCEEAVEIAVRMTERQIAENVLNSNLPPTEEVTNEP
ncbi:hypothetical protein V3390_09390 [Luteimonas sp. FXH3W]|uniref:Uncharacterized protein n=1 Tax=Aquilutibacter rugosus TaxID=3115820 RepID=A0ABU7V1L7_9GAMM